jgi:hypothetical protein
MTTIVDIFKRVAEKRGWDQEYADEAVIEEKNLEKRVWNEVMKQMHEPFLILSEAIDQGLEHAAICLELLPRPKKQTKAGNKGEPADADVEARGEDLKPGEAGFAKVVDAKVQAFWSKKGEILRTWVKERGLTDSEEDRDLPEYAASPERRERDQAQLYVVLYMESLMHASGEAVQDLVAFADGKVEDGTMSKNRLIVPSNKRLRKWLRGIFKTQDESADQSTGFTSTNMVHLGDGYNNKKDPEHLPPETTWQRFSNGLRKISRFFASEESAFGFRAACATMTIGIVAFLERTQQFFQEQRLVWAMIIIAIGMTMSELIRLFLLSPDLTLTMLQLRASRSLASSAESAAPSWP